MSTFAARLGLAFALAALLTLGGCLSQLIPETAPPPATFDFGPPPESPPAQLPMRVTLDPVTAPSWLEGTDILYRRLDEQPGALRAYARNAWIAAAPELFSQRLRNRLRNAVPNDPPELEAGLTVELLTFEHVFTQADDAHVLARVRATLLTPDGRTLRRELEVRRPAAASARGATEELPRAADELIDALIGWLRTSGDQ